MIGLIAPGDERGEATGLVLQCAQPQHVFDALCVCFDGAVHHRRRGAQTGVEAHGLDVAEQLAQARTVGLGVHHIADARRLVLDLDGTTDELLDEREHVEQRSACAVREVDRLGVGDTADERRGEDRGDRVDEREVATLFARAVHRYQHAAERGVPQAQVALAWLLHRPGVTAPIVGATKLGHLEDALAAEDLELSPKGMERLEELYVPHPVLGHE